MSKPKLDPDMERRMLEALKNIKPISCAEYGHSWHHTGFGGGMIHWRCSRCGACNSTPDTPVSI